MAENQQPRKKSTAKPPPVNLSVVAAVAGTPAAGPATPSPSVDQRRVSVIVPPDRHQQMMNENTRRVSVIQGPNPQLQVLMANSRRQSVVQQPSASQVSLPEKFRKHSMARAPLLAQLQMMDTIPSGAMSTGRRDSSSGNGTLRKGSDSGLQPGSYHVRKRNKAEVEEYHSRIRTISKFHKSQSSGSLASYSSTISSVSSSFSISSEVATNGMDTAGGVVGGGASVEWTQRWVIDKVGRLPGQIKCASDICFLRSTGNIAIAEFKNARIQIFSSSGKSLACLGPESDNDRTAASFTNPLNFRRISPTGICETNINNLLAVTDHSRLLYIDASSTGLLEAEVIINNRNSLRGVAFTQNNKLILTEVGTQASVGIFETNGRLVREFKGDFKEPSYVAWNEEYEIAAVSDSGQRAVYLYDAGGHLLNKLGALQLHDSQSDEEIGPLVYPAGVSWISDGRLLVADRAEHRVVLFDLRNQSAENILTDQDGLGNPVALATNAKNRIVISEEFYDFGVDKYQLKLFKHRVPTLSNEF